MHRTRSRSLRALVPVGALALALGAVLGCGKSDKTDKAGQADKPGSGDKADVPKAADPPADTAGRPANGKEPAPVQPAADDGPPAFDPKLQRIVEGSSCEGYGAQISKTAAADEFERSGNTWSRSEFWGCGCAKGPEFTLVYKAGSPLELRLCHDEAKDPCEMGCRQVVAWDLSEQLAAAKATDVSFPDP